MKLKKIFTSSKSKSRKKSQKIKKSHFLLFTASVAIVGTIVLINALAASPSPSGKAMPVGNLDGWKQIFAEDFTKDAPTGSWGSVDDASKIVYTGEAGTKWVTYPTTYKDTYQKRPYRSDKVLSVHDGSLDFHLQNVDGQPAGANPSPVITGSSQYQTYGRYSARVKVDNTDLSEYYMAWLLWPQNESQWESAESDYPEGNLAPGKKGVSGFHHYGPGGQQEYLHDSSIDLHEWHTYTQEWTPTQRKYYVDDKLIHTSTHPVYNGPERWQLQTETNGNGNNSGHLLVDWVTVYQYSPGTVASSTQAPVQVPPSPTPIPAVETAPATPATPVTIPGTTTTSPPAPTADTTKPSAPAEVKVSEIKATGATISWNASTDNVGIASYDVYIDGKYFSWSPKNRFVATELKCNTDYTTKIVSLDEARNYGESSTVSFKTSPCTESVPTPNTSPTPPLVVLYPEPSIEAVFPQEVSNNVVVPVPPIESQSSTSPEKVVGTSVKVDGKKAPIRKGALNTRHLKNGNHVVSVEVKTKDGKVVTQKATLKVQNNLNWWEKARNFLRNVW